MPRTCCQFNCIINALFQSYTITKFEARERGLCHVHILPAVYCNILDRNSNSPYIAQNHDQARPVSLITKRTCTEVCLTADTSVHPFGCLGYAAWLSMTLIERNREKMVSIARSCDSYKAIKHQHNLQWPPPLSYSFLCRQLLHWDCLG